MIIYYHTIHQRCYHYTNPLVYIVYMPATRILMNKEVRNPKFWRGILAEMMGSLVFVSVVLGSSLSGHEGVSSGPLYPALAAGMVAVCLGHCFRKISGAQVRNSSYYITSNVF